MQKRVRIPSLFCWNQQLEGVGISIGFNSERPVFDVTTEDAMSKPKIIFPL